MPIYTPKPNAPCDICGEICVNLREKPSAGKQSPPSAGNQPSLQE